MKVARAELLRRVAELGQRREEQEKLLQRLEVRLIHYMPEQLSLDTRISFRGCGLRLGTRPRL